MTYRRKFDFIRGDVGDLAESPVNSIADVLRRFTSTSNDNQYNSLFTTIHFITSRQSNVAKNVHSLDASHAVAHVQTVQCTVHVT